MASECRERGEKKNHQKDREARTLLVSASDN
eukprot:CAMPEP_0117694556 /NCGR_PEP_ID=MMETSP0804-20121206/27566_1 /TAXON_ID=1074897 /ORGANISM="Tetraselmis astigmatica, Strain CCMP880" /LENGTH=30 /DNA_ID= /DNA_START= /DNA_END= /DNA_ORIENTATION=